MTSRQIYKKKKQKHPLVKRVLPALLAASIAVGTFAANAFAVGSDDRYDKAYTIGNILSDFQYFTKGDLKGSGHTVGAVAVGGTMDKGNSFGNGAVTPSFINKIDQAAAASPIVTNGKFSVSFNDGLSVPAEAGAFNIYYMAESKAPNGYKVSDSVYVCRIDNSGAAGSNCSSANGSGSNLILRHRTELLDGNRKKEE